ncbi:MAG: cystathionine-beta-synthase domain harboring protein [Acidimicrobiaceae bacterium]|nr:MAG: cystathionine-beta-synthase domain harboring protein [Acidimicrobiaceae bacterium]
MVACLAKRADGEELGRLAARGGDSPDATLEAGDALLERGDGGVGDAAVDVAVLLQREQVGRVRRVLEHEARGLEHRYRPRSGGRVGPRPGVDGTRAKAPGTFCRHAATLVAIAWRHPCAGRVGGAQLSSTVSGLVGSAAHSCNDAAYTATSLNPSLVRTNALDDAAIPPPQ